MQTQTITQFDDELTAALGCRWTQYQREHGLQLEPVTVREVEAVTFDAALHQLYQSPLEQYCLAIYTDWYGQETPGIARLDAEGGVRFYPGPMAYGNYWGCAPEDLTLGPRCTRQGRSLAA